VSRIVAAIITLLLVSACSQVERAVVVHPADSPPETLDEWGIMFVDDGRLEFNDRVLPYELNTPLFSDYALKLRSIWMPKGTSAHYADSGVFEFPVGTILSKTFHYEKAVEWTADAQTVLIADRNALPDDDGSLSLDDHVLIETRLLVRYADGWRALPYVWNAAQDQAFLEVAGELRSLQLVGAQFSQKIAYVIPDTNQCAGCHTPNHSSKQLRPLGPRAWQLNRSYDYGAATANQLEFWQAHGFLDMIGEDVPHGVSWLAPGDASLEQRAKAYLDANCAHCHNVEGAADTSALHLNIEAPVDRFYGVCKTPVAVGRGSGNRPYDIYPGRPDESILLYRMQHSDPAIAMPELGRSAMHAEAVAVIRDWIAGMNGEC